MVEPAYDLVHLAMRQAADAFGGSDGTFNAAGFSIAMTRISGLNGSVLDGHMVRAILCGRQDVVILPGGAHFQLSARKYPSWGTHHADSIS